MNKNVGLFLSASLMTAPVGLIPAQTAVAPETPASEMTVIVSATRTAEAQQDVPYSTTVIGQQAIKDSAVRSLPDALKYSPGINVQKTSPGQGSPYIRGFTGYRTLSMIDGIRLNNSVFREGANQYLNTVDAFGISSLEITRGQGSVLYGSDAIGGTINALTKGPRYAESAALAAMAAVPDKNGKNPMPAAPTLQEETKLLGGSLFGRYASGENSYQARPEGFYSDAGKFGVFLGVTGKQFGTVRAAGLGDLPFTGYEELDFDAKMEFWLSPDTKLTFAHQQVHQNDVERTHRTIYSVPFRGTTLGTEQRHTFDQTRYLSYLRLEGAASGFADDYSLTLSHHRQSETRNRIRAVTDGRRDLEGFDVDTYGVDFQLNKETSIGKLTYGFDYYLDDVSSFRDNFAATGEFTASDIQGAIGDDAKYHLAGLFLQDQIKLNDQWEVTLGVRGTYARADIGKVSEVPVTGNSFSIEDDWFNVSGSARVLYNIDREKKHKVYAGVSQGFRAPNLSDLSRFDTARTSELETPAPGLDPEKFVNFELGYKVNGPRFNAGLAVFYTDIQDLIVRTPTGRIIDGNFEVSKKNAGEGYVYGLELDFDWEFVPQWNLFGNFAWQSGNVNGFPTSADEQVQEPLRGILPATGVIGVRWRAADEKFWLESVLQLSDKMDSLNAADRADTQRIPPDGTPAYAVLSIRGGWRPTDNLTLTAGVENVTDEEYRYHGSGSNEPGVNVVVGAELKF